MIRNSSRISSTEREGSSVAGKGVEVSLTVDTMEPVEPLLQGT